MKAFDKGFNTNIGTINISTPSVIEREEFKYGRMDSVTLSKATPNQTKVTRPQEILVRQPVKTLIVDDSTYNLFVMKELLSQIDPSMEIE